MAGTAAEANAEPRPRRMAIVSAVPGDDTALRFLILHLNTVQCAFEFEFLPLFEDDPFIQSVRSRHPVNRQDLRSDGDPFYERHCKSMSSLAGAYRIEHSAPDRLLILSTARFDDNYYVTRTRRVTVFALGNWRRFMAPPSLTEFFVSLVISEALTTVAPSLRGWGHLGTKGCSLDFCALLTDARQQALSSFLCRECRDRIDQEGQSSALPAIDRMLSRSWLGDSTDLSSVAGITSSLKHDLFVVKGLNPTVWETFRSTLRQDGFRQLIGLISAVATSVMVAAALLVLGWKS